MYKNHIIKVIIPAYNEEDSVGRVLTDIPDWVDQVILVDNGSTDQTAQVASEHGALVVHEPRRGYGQACLTGIDHLDYCDIVVFLDADYSDFPEEMPLLVAPIADNKTDMVIGSRIANDASSKVLTTTQRFGNSLACFLMKCFWRSQFTDLGPFRAIRFHSLKRIKMEDRNFGWTIEMQIKALRAKLRVMEIPVSYRQRIGYSKISGTLKGMFSAGTIILWTIAKQIVNPTRFYHSKKNKLIIFSRYPLPGQAKTRMIPKLGNAGAAHLQRQLTEYTINSISPLLNSEDLNIEVQYHGGDHRKLQQWLGADIDYQQQSPGDLGHKLHQAFLQSFEQGHQNIIIIGTDCTDLNAIHITKAINALEQKDVVIGPSHDGGYWLIGMRRPLNLFKQMRWGTNSVFPDTINQLNQQKIEYDLLEELSDIDTPEDLVKTPPNIKTNKIYLSIIIPTLNEERFIRRAIDSARHPGTEIIVVDGNSQDKTVEIAASSGAKVIKTMANRAMQMNAGASIAQGHVLLFLHADTLIQSDNYFENIFDTFSNPNIVGGAFSFKTTVNSIGMQLLEWTVKFRSKVSQLPYGDQALFVRKDLFITMGGFPEVDLGEDYYFIQKLKEQGKLCHLPINAITSARKWENQGLIKTTLSNIIALIGFKLGVSNKFLYKLTKQFES